MQGKIHFTKQGYQKMREEFQRLQQRRPQAVEELQRARELGDLSENGAYKAARHELSTIDSRIRKIDRLLQNAVVVNPNINGIINIGSVITLEKNGEIVEYYIVGEYEADPSLKKISNISPIGRELIGKKAGDIITISTPGGTVTYTLVSVQ